MCLNFSVDAIKKITETLVLIVKNLVITFNQKQQLTTVVVFSLGGDLRLS